MIEFDRFFEGLFDCLGGDFVKKNSIDLGFYSSRSFGSCLCTFCSFGFCPFFSALFRAADRLFYLFGKMPRDRFAFAVGIGRQINFAGSVRRLDNFVNDLLFTFNDLVGRLETVFDVNAEL